MDLVIVESPAKAQTIQKYLGKDYLVLASKGHITDLAKGGKFGMGIDINNNFKTHYVLMENSIRILNELIDAAKKCNTIYLASDPDREGSMISYQISQRLQDLNKPFKRAIFNEIKKDKILKAIKTAGEIDMNMVNSALTRRIIDRIVGFSTSPFLINFFGPNLSSGRVQSVVTRMIIDREREIESFIPEDFWTIQVSLNDGQDSFTAKYINRITDQKTADLIKNQLNTQDYLVSEIISDEDRKPAPAPLITSSMQRLMSKNFGWTSDRTMKAAQSLYESGYCSYIRTDSQRIGDEALQEVRQWLSNKNLPLPTKPNIFKNKDASQDAHECIRPSDISLLPDQNYAIIDPDEKSLYEIIWKYFVASQMKPAIYDTLKVIAHPKNNPAMKVSASGKALKFKGFLEILGIDDKNSIDIPNLTIGQSLKLDKNSLKLEKKQTQPPPRYSEDKLIKELVQKGIGRPATYADLLSKITSRNYVERKGSVFHATDLGKKITDILTKFFTFMDYNYTAQMESQLDEIENGKISYLEMLNKFYPLFKKEINKAYLDSGGILCDKCSSPMTTRVSKTGEKFLACSAFPKCKNTLSHYEK